MLIRPAREGGFPGGSQSAASKPAWVLVLGSRSRHPGLSAEAGPPGLPPTRTTVQGEQRQACPASCDSAHPVPSSRQRSISARTWAEAWPTPARRSAVPEDTAVPVDTGLRRYDEAGCGTAWLKGVHPPPRTAVRAGGNGFKRHASHRAGKGDCGWPANTCIVTSGFAAGRRPGKGFASKRAPGEPADRKLAEVGTVVHHGASPCDGSRPAAQCREAGG